MPLTTAQRSKLYRGRKGLAHFALVLDADDLALFLVDTGEITKEEAKDRHNIGRGLEKMVAGMIFRHAVTRRKPG